MNKYAIDLSDRELDVLARIELDASKFDHRRVEANASAVLELLQMLLDRKAIPEVRRRYWSDPDYQLSRLKGSHKSLFERNNCRGMEIYKHWDFLPFLRYFIFGSSLSEPMKTAFEDRVGNPAWVTSSDIVPICKFVRLQARQNRLAPDDAREGFFQLALDMGFHLMNASAFAKAAYQAK